MTLSTTVLTYLFVCVLLLYFQTSNTAADAMMRRKTASIASVRLDVSMPPTKTQLARTPVPMGGGCAWLSAATDAIPVAASLCHLWCHCKLMYNTSTSCYLLQEPVNSGVPRHRRASRWIGNTTKAPRTECRGFVPVVVCLYVGMNDRVMFGRTLTGTRAHIIDYQCFNAYIILPIKTILLKPSEAGPACVQDIFSVSRCNDRISSLLVVVYLKDRTNAGDNICIVRTGTIVYTTDDPCYDVDITILTMSVLYSLRLEASPVCAQYIVTVMSCFAPLMMGQEQDTSYAGSISMSAMNMPCYNVYLLYIFQLLIQSGAQARWQRNTLKPTLVSKKCACRNMMRKQSFKCSRSSMIFLHSPSNAVTKCLLLLSVTSFLT